MSIKGTAKASCLKSLLDGFKSPTAQRERGNRGRECGCVYVSLSVSVCLSVCLRVRRTVSKEVFQSGKGWRSCQTGRLQIDRAVWKRWSYAEEGVAELLSLTDRCHGEWVVPNSRISNGRRRCLCRHGDGAVPKEVVMG